MKRPRGQSRARRIMIGMEYLEPHPRMVESQVAMRRVELALERLQA